MDTERAVVLLNQQIETSKQLQGFRTSSPEFKRWKRDTEIVIERVFGKGTRHLKDFTSVSYSLGIFSSATPDSDFQRAYNRELETARQILESMIEEVREFGTTESGPESDGLRITLSIIFDRFHLIARQLRERHGSRDTVEIEDEYDVQDLLHALLHLISDDIRVEEWTPSYAGGSSRADFFLKKENTVIEVKKTRRGLRTREIGDQLIIDISRYQSHPGCRRLMCFVYDPEGRVANPVGLERDLTKKHGELNVIVIVTPKGR